MNVSDGGTQGGRFLINEKGERVRFVEDEPVKAPKPVKPEIPKAKTKTNEVND